MIPAEKKYLPREGSFLKLLVNFVPAQSGNLWSILSSPKIIWKKRLAVLLIGVLLMPIFSPPAQALFGFWESSSVPEVQRDRLVSFLVEESLLEDLDLEYKIKKYATNVETAVNGEVIFIPIPKDASPLDIYEGNAHLYFSGVNFDGRSQLVGTILIGDVPLPVVEKEGNLWPTVFPYVDFEDPVYEWDYEKERFVFKGGATHQPEVWHGVLRSPSREDEGWDADKLKEFQNDELGGFLQTNDAVHQGTETFGENVFSADLSESQAKGLGDVPLQKYQTWIDNIEDVAYMRYTKHWAKEVMNLLGPEDIIDTSVIAENMRPPADATPPGDLMTNVPDIHTKLIIESAMKRYYETWKGKLSLDNDKIGEGGRWGPEDSENTIILISQKDEESAVTLKNFNDQLEGVLNTALVASNVAGDIKVKTTEDVDIDYIIPMPLPAPPIPMTQTREKDLYWNGVLRADMDVDDCSLLRGTPRTTSYPHAQMVEANRTYNRETSDEEYPSAGDPDRLCENVKDNPPNWGALNSWWNDDDDEDETKNYIDINEDVFEACCALNIEITTDPLNYENDYCETGSEWVTRDYLGLGVLTPYPPADDDDPTLTNQYREHVGATEPLFDITGTKEMLTGNYGAQGCEDILDASGDKTIDSLFLHVEPTVSTIAHQMEDGGSVALPVDKPRGFSFYDAGWDFHRIDYFNAFKFIGRHAEVEDEEARKELLEQEILDELQSKIAEINAASAGGAISSDVFEAYTNDLREVVNSIIWIDKDIEEKNRITFEIAISPVEEARAFMQDDDFHDGYELMSIVAEKAEDGKTGEQGIQTGFQQGDDPDGEAFQDARLKEAQFSFNDGAEVKDLHEKAKNNFDFESQKSSLSQCSGKNVIAWFPCFLGWLTGLPAFLMQKFTVLPDPPPSENSEESSSDESSQESSSSNEQSVEEFTVIPPSDKSKDVREKVTALKVSTPKINVAAGDMSPVILEVDLKNKAGTSVQSGDDQTIELEFDSSNGQKFFDVFPGEQAPVIGGKAIFTLFPKDNDVGGKFEMKMKSDGKVLQTIPVNVSKYGLSFSPEKERVVVNNKEGMLLQAKITTPDGYTSKNRDGGMLLFESAWGTFGNKGYVTIKNGRAEIIFYPGIRSGEAKITLKDTVGLLPIVTESIKILPGEIADIVLESRTEILVHDSQFVPLTAQAIDVFGNNVPEQGIFTWTTHNLEVRDVASPEQFEMPMISGKSKIFVRPEQKLPFAETTVSLKLPLEEISQKQIFKVPQKVVLRIEAPKTKTQAGAENPLELFVRAETKEGKRINYDLEVGVLANPEGIGQFQENLTLKEGIGDFSFFAGTKSGETIMSFTSSGFENGMVELEVAPDDPVKILTASDSVTMDREDENAEINLDVTVVDQFGNIDTTFNKKIYLLPNQPGNVTSSDRDALVELGVVSEASGAQLALEEAAEAARATGTSPDTSLLETENGWSLNLLRGEGSLEITPSGTGTGKILMSVEAPNLVPSTIEFTVTDYLTTEEIEELGPKSLFSLLLGFDGGDLLTDKNIASAFLFAGSSQAVGTLITPPEAKKRIGYLAGDGYFTGEIEAEVRTGQNLYTVDLKDSIRSLGKAFVKFKEPAEFFVTRAKGTLPGVYFVPEEDQIDILKREGDSILLEGNHVFSVHASGGIELVQGGATFTIEGDSFLETTVVVGKKKIGTITVVSPQESIVEVESLNRISSLSEGIFVIIEVKDIQIAEAFTGASTNDNRGLVLIDPNEEESPSRMLGAPHLSAEDVQNDPDILWKKSWKPAALFAAGNMVGDSTKWNSSDAFILLGDPTATLATANTASDNGLTDDIGKPIWKSPDGSIEQILVGDLNADGVPDIMNLVGDTLFALYQENSEIDNFRDTGPLLRFADGVSKVLLVDNDHDDFVDILQLNGEGKLLLHKNTNGTFSREGEVDLGEFEGKIKEIYVGDFNGDRYLDDLTFADEEKSLWTAMGTKNVGKFSPVEHIESFAPTLDPIEEIYEVAKEQDWNRRIYLEQEKFPNLENIFVSYEGIKEDITEKTPDKAIKFLQSEEKLPEDAFQRNLGEGGLHLNFGSVPVSTEKLEDITKSLQGAETSQEQLAIMTEEILGEGDFQTVFLEIPFQMKIDAEFTLEQEETGPLQKGNTLKAGVSFTPKMALENFEFLIPHMQGMEYVKDSFVCNGCNGEIAFREEVPDDMELWGYLKEEGLSSGVEVFMTWNLTVAELTPLEFEVFDFDINDGLDDILIGWEQDGEKQMIQYLSSTPNHNGTEFPHGQKIVPITTPTDPTPLAKEKYMNLYKTGSANGNEGAGGEGKGVGTGENGEDELPPTWDGFGIINQKVKMSLLSCGGCGLAAKIPSIAIPPFAPGKQTLYVPPFAIISLPKFPTPLPALTIDPVTCVATAGFCPPFTPATAYQSSVFRFYTMPTTSAHLALGFCGLLPAIGDVTQYPLGNCVVVDIPILQALGSIACPSDSSGGGQSSETQDSLRDIIDDFNPSEFKPDFKKYKSNIAIHATEVVQDWIDAQKDEFNNIKLPTPKLWKPKLPQMRSEEQKEQEDKEVSPLFSPNSEVLGRNLWKKLEQKSWITVTPKRYTFPYPVFPKKNADGDNLEVVKYKMQIQAWKDAADKYKTQKQEAKADYQSSCKGQMTSESCQKYLKNIEAFDEFISSVEQNAQALDNNWDAIKSYEEFPKMMRELYDEEKGKITQLGKQFEKYAKAIETYVFEWLEANDRAIDKWKQFKEEIKEFFASFGILLEAFTNFKADCPTCSVERGSSTTVLINLLLGSIKLPVIPAPRLPDIFMDFSRIDISLELPIPEVELQPVQMAYPDIPPPPEVNLQVNVPGLPVIPVLPKMPDISVNIQIPNLELPNLPVLVDPPVLPDLFVTIRPIFDLLKMFLKLFCLIVQNFLTIPENTLAGHVQQITNRTLLWGIDFTFPSFSLNAPQVPQIDDVEITVEAHIKLPTLIFEILNESLEVLQEFDECLVGSLGEILRGAPPPDNCSFSGAGVFSYQPENYKTSEVKYSIVANGTMPSPVRIEQGSTEKRMWATIQSSARWVAQLVEPKTNVFSTINPKRFSTWLTSVVDVGAIPTEAPTDFDTDAFRAAQLADFEQEPDVYYFNPETGESESVTGFPLDDLTAYTFADLGDDHNEEVLFALESELFLKYRVTPDIDEDDLEKKYEQKHDDNYDDRFGNFTEWDYETFREKFAPARAIQDSLEATGTTFQFERISNGTSYFEWVVTDRPDFIFEYDEDFSNRESEQWNRHAFLLRPAPTRYEIRPMTTQITRIKGSPILYSSPAEAIPRFKQKDCDNPEKEKPFYATESLLVGIDNYSRFEIRVPPREGRPEQVEEKVLHKGEETIVEYGEVCLTRGNVERIDMMTTEKVSPRANTYLPSGSRMELGANDQVILELFDETQITIYPNENYTLYVFEEEDELIRAFQLLKQKNQYGAFQAFTKEGDSFFVSKYLHDPQGDDDVTPPDISLVGGSKISALAFQPVFVDASPTKDSEHNIERVWWDLYPHYDADKDGDPTNDQDFPDPNEEKYYLPRDLLKVELPAYEKEGTFNIMLHVEDEPGNRASEELEVIVRTPIPKIEEASVRSSKVKGGVRGGIADIPITVERNRRGVWESIREEPIVTNDSGDFDLSGLDTSGGIEIKDFTGEEAFEVLENGRPVLYNDLFDITVLPANNIHPTQILLRNEQDAPMAIVSFVIPGEKDVVLDTEELVFELEPAVHVLDRNTQDTIYFSATSEGNVLVKGRQPLALIDRRGDFYGNLRLQIQATKRETDPVVFEILNTDDSVLGSFTISVGENAPIDLKQSTQTVDNL